MFLFRRKGDQRTANPNEDITLARQALRKGDLTHGVSHLASALATDPTRRDWLALLDEFIRRAHDAPLRLAPLETTKPTYFGTVAVRAYILMRMGRLDEGVAHLLQVIRLRPDIPYGAWLLDWQRKPGFANALNPALVADLAQELLLHRFPGVVVATEADRVALGHLIPLFALTASLHPEEPDLQYYHVAALRKAGRLAEAVQVAQEMRHTAPSYRTAVALAMVYKAQGAVDAAVEAYEMALNFAPDDTTVRNDLADLLSSQGRIEEGVRWYKEVLDREPREEWALPSYYYYMHLLHPNEGWGAKVAALATGPPPNARARVLMRDIRDGAVPYLHALPPAGEATIQVVQNLLARAEAQGVLGVGGRVRMAVSHLESPSARLAVDLHLAAHGVTWRVMYDVMAVPTPDTRFPLRPVAYVVWAYDGTTPRPNVAVPSSDVVEAVAAIAREPYNLPRWRAPARRLAAALGPTAVEGLLGTMVHPPALPADRVAWDWVRQVQIAAALVLAYMGEGAGSAALHALAYGPMDWTGVAAIVALADRAVQDLVTGRETEELFLDLLDHQPSEGDWVLETPLLYSLARLPELSERGRATLATHQNRQ